MKLLQRTSRYQLLLAVPLLLAGTAIGYAVVRAVVTEEVDEQLEFETARIAEELRAGQRTFTGRAVDELVVVEPGRTSTAGVKDSTIYIEQEREEMPWRVMNTTIVLEDGTSFTVTVGRSMLEAEDLVVGMAVTMAALLALMVFGSWLLNRWLAQRLWQPFRSTLDELQRFQVDGPGQPALPDTDVDEFTTMNRTLGAMMNKLRNDFVVQKRFTEQAAHELQTPLAIMQGKLDQLIQSPNMKEHEAGVIDGLFQARERMGRTVSNMLLLARIGNQQFAPEPIDWLALFTEQRSILDGLITERGINYSIDQEQPCALQLHPLLAEVLVGNLLRNAVQHNLPFGSITVVIGGDGFSIINTGPALDVAPGTLFDRFAKGDSASPSTGLGLSMAKEIADQNGLQLAYTYSAGTHTLAVRGA